MLAGPFVEAADDDHHVCTAEANRWKSVPRSPKVLEADGYASLISRSSTARLRALSGDAVTCYPGEGVAADEGPLNTKNADSALNAPWFSRPWATKRGCVSWNPCSSVKNA